MKTKFISSNAVLLLAFLLSMSWISMGQGKVSTVTGTVTDEKGEPLIGVNIILKETSKGTTTNVDGKYSISITNAQSKLLFSFVS